MKRYYFLILLALLILTGRASADCNRDTDKFSSDQWCIDTQDTLIPSQSAGLRVIYENITSPGIATNVLTPDESGKIIVDTGGGTPGGACGTGGGGKHLLPAATPGLTFTLIAGSKCFVTLDTLLSDTILKTISGTSLDPGDSLKSTGQAGDAITVMSPSAGVWAVTNQFATWTDNGTN